MHTSHYVIVGSSHAALEAITAIRLADPEGSLTLLTRETRPPYSPTILPYVISGRSDPDRIALRDEEFFARERITLRKDATVTKLDTTRREVGLADGTRLAYDKLLLATGAAPLIPPVPGLDSVRYHQLRNLDDSLALRHAMETARRAVVLGGGLIGMHAAENFSRAGIGVTVIERCPQILPNYFDTTAASWIAGSFAAQGVDIRTGRTVTSVHAEGMGCSLTLDDGSELRPDLLLVATGVAAATGYLNGGTIVTDRGILVDETMQTSDASVWAAGDAAQAPVFGSETKAVSGILPEAVAQGRIAGMAMAGDTSLAPYPGSVPRNTYNFFGKSAVSVGSGIAGVSPPGTEITVSADVANGRYCRIALHDNRLIGIAAINLPLDAGIMCELIRRGIDLTPVKQRFLADPCGAGRVLMSRLWR